MSFSVDPEVYKYFGKLYYIFKYLLKRRLLESILKVNEDCYISKINMKRQL